jgi:outer membrane receptor protein involved in Fe transport
MVFRPWTYLCDDRSSAVLLQPVGRNTRGGELQRRSQRSNRCRASDHPGSIASARHSQSERAPHLGGRTSTCNIESRLTNAPDWSGRVWLEWNHDIGRAGALSFRADLTSQSTVYFTPFNGAIQRQPPYGQLNLSAQFEPRRRCCTIRAHVRNVTNEDYITGSFSSPPPAIGRRPGQPRQARIELAVRR